MIMSNCVCAFVEAKRKGEKKKSRVQEPINRNYIIHRYVGSKYSAAQQIINNPSARQKNYLFIF